MKKIILITFIVLKSSFIYPINLFTLSGVGMVNLYSGNGYEIKEIDNKIYTILWDLYFKNSHIIYSEVGSNLWSKNIIKGQAYFISDNRICSIYIENKKIKADVYSKDIKELENLVCDYIPNEKQIEIRELVPFSNGDDICICEGYLYEPKNKFMAAFYHYVIQKDTSDFAIKIFSFKNGNHNNIYIYNLTGSYFFSSTKLDNINFKFEEVKKNNETYYNSLNRYKYLINQKFIYEVSPKITRQFLSTDKQFKKLFSNPSEFSNHNDDSSILDVHSLYSIHEDNQYTYFCDYSSSTSHLENLIYLYYKKINELNWSKKIIKFSKSITIDNLQIFSFNNFIYIGVRSYDRNNGGIFRMITLTEDELLSKDPMIEIKNDDNIVTDSDLEQQNFKKEYERWKAEKEKKGKKVNLKI